MINADVFATPLLLAASGKHSLSSLPEASISIRILELVP